MLAVKSSNATKVADSDERFDILPNQEALVLYIDVEGSGTYSLRNGEVTLGCQLETCSELVQ